MAESRPASRWNWLVSIADQGLVSASSFLTLVAISRSVHPEEVGRYALVYAGVMIVTSLQAALVTTPHAAPRRPRRRLRPLHLSRQPVRVARRIVAGTTVVLRARAALVARRRARPAAARVRICDVVTVPRAHAHRIPRGPEATACARAR